MNAIGRMQLCFSAWISIHSVHHSISHHLLRGRLKVCFSIVIVCCLTADIGGRKDEQGPMKRHDTVEHAHAGIFLRYGVLGFYLVCRTDDFFGAAADLSCPVTSASLRWRNLSQKVTFSRSVGRR